MSGKAQILDASVALKCFFAEADSERAQDLVLSQADWIAPELIFLEVANVAALRVRRGLSPADAATQAIGGLRALLLETSPLDRLVGAALELAVQHGFSAHDAAYVALAVDEESVVLTADLKLAQRAEAAGLADYVRTL
jgi:predicted nucleic acid-binding protein